MERFPSGILVVDKPENITSARVVDRIKRFPGIKKAGHTGTLDPMATGVMLCPVNRATRLSRFFLHGEKSYHAVMALGVETDTQDAEGNITFSCRVPEIDELQIQKIMDGFRGEIKQKPPAYSALKHKGVPLYEYARQGRPVQKPARTVLIEEIKVKSIKLPEIEFKVTCSSGTYIRTLCSEIGSKIGCGAHLKKLRRTKSSGFGIEEAVPLRDIEKTAAQGRIPDLLVPMSAALRGIPACIADKALTEKIKYGKIIFKHDVGDLPETEYIKFVDENENLLAVLCRSGAEDRLDYCCVFNHS